MDPQPFLRATRFLLDDPNKELRAFVEAISGSVEVAVPVLLQCKTFEDYLAATETDLTIDETPIDMKEISESNDLVTLHHFVISQLGLRTQEEPVQVAQWGLRRGKRAQMDSNAKRLFDYTYENLRKAAGV